MHHIAIALDIFHDPSGFEVNSPPTGSSVVRHGAHSLHSSLVFPRQWTRFFLVLPEPHKI